MNNVTSFFDFETTGVTSADAPIQVAGIICEEFGPIITFKRTDYPPY